MRWLISRGAVKSEETIPSAGPTTYPMNETLEFLIRHGYTLLFVGVLTEQIALPFAAIPLLLAAGAFAMIGIS